MASNQSNITETDDSFVCESAISFQFWAWGVLANLIIVYGIVGNILSIIVLSHAQMRNSTSVYLISLAVYDCTVLLSMCLFLAIPTLYLEKGILEDYYLAYPYMHPFCYPIALVAQTGTIYTTMAFTVERYIAVCWPLHAANTCTMSRTKRVIVTIFLCSVIYNFPRFLETTTIENWSDYYNRTIPEIQYTDLGSNQTFQEAYFIYLNLFVMFLIPFLILSVLNVLLILAVNNAKKARTKMSSSASKETNMTVMLIAVIMVFLFCQLPSIADNILWAIFDDQTKRCSRHYIQFTTISNLMVVVNSASNFILYCLFGKRFRRVFIKIFYLKKKEPQYKYTIHEGSCSRRLNGTKVSDLDTTYL